MKTIKLITAHNPYAARLIKGYQVTEKPKLRRWTKATYQEYLKSEWWQERRKRALEKAGYKCQVCGDGEDLQVHHKTYDRLYQERDSDLIVLCAYHHEEVHGIGDNDDVG